MNNVQTLEAYVYAIAGNKPDDREDIKAIRKDFNLSECRKIVAHAVNTLQPIYEKFNPQCIGGEYGVEDKYDLGVTDSFGIFYSAIMS